MVGVANENGWEVETAGFSEATAGAGAGAAEILLVEPNEVEDDVTSGLAVDTVVGNEKEDVSEGCVVGTGSVEPNENFGSLEEPEEEVAGIALEAMVSFVAVVLPKVEELKTEEKESDGGLLLREFPAAAAVIVVPVVFVFAVG